MLQPAYDQYNARRRNDRLRKIQMGFLVIAVALALLAMVIAMGGCSLLQKAAPGAVADTPSKRWAQSREALTSANDLFTLLARSGKLTDAQIVTYGKTLQNLGVMLGAAEQDLPAGGAGFEATLGEVVDLLGKLRTTLLEASHERNSGSTADGDRRVDPGDQRNHQGDRGGQAAGGDPADHRRDHARAAGGHPGTWERLRRAA